MLGRRSGNGKPLRPQDFGSTGTVVRGHKWGHVEAPPCLLASIHAASSVVCGRPQPTIKQSNWIQLDPSASREINALGAFVFQGRRARSVEPGS